MPIPAEHTSRHAYHFCHLENLENVLKHGLLSCNEQIRLKIKHLSVAEKSIQDRRATMPVTCNPNGVVHDYVPFYFCKRSSMLLSVVQRKNVDQQFLIYFVVPIQLVEQEGVVFTSASANTGIAPEFFYDPSDLSKLDWKLIDSLKWKLTESEKQARMAELLVNKQVPLQAVKEIIVWNDSIGECVARAFKKAGKTPPPIRADGHYYFNK